MTAAKVNRKTRRGVFGFLGKETAQRVAGDELNVALDRLAQAMLENSLTCARVRRRQSSGSLKLVSVPPEEGPTSRRPTDE